MAQIYKEGSLDVNKIPFETTLIELYWDDLTEKTQNEIRDILGLEPGDDNNWTYIPLAIMEIEGEEQHA